MPNHTSTILIITGNISEIRKFIAAVDSKENPLEFNNLVPMPKELEGTTSPTPGDVPETTIKRLVDAYGASNWYDWCRKNWGTKWGAYNADSWIVEEDQNRASIFYNTAWTPATAFYLTASKQFPSLRFKHKFADEGGAFLGYETIRNGKIIKSESFEWDSKAGIRLRSELGAYDPDEEEN